MHSCRPSTPCKCNVKSCRFRLKELIAALLVQNQERATAPQPLKPTQCWSKSTLAPLSVGVARKTPSHTPRSTLHCRPLHRSSYSSSNRPPPPPLGRYAKPAVAGSLSPHCAMDAASSTGAPGCGMARGGGMPPLRFHDCSVPCARAMRSLVPSTQTGSRCALRSTPSASSVSLHDVWAGVQV
eukprot:242006-Chlamydomonas_euryale.AAC.4